MRKSRTSSKGRKVYRKDREEQGVTVRVAESFESSGRRLRGPLHRFAASRVKRAMGWLRDLPDFRDVTMSANAPLLITPNWQKDRDLLSRVTKSITKRRNRKSKEPWDQNERYCSAIEDQRELGSCTANACAGLIEYMENRSANKYIDASRLFLYKVTRNLLGWTGDTGAYLRTTMKALVLFGTPPEEYWSYDDLSTFDREPDAFMYSFAANYKALRYMRLDPPGLSGDEVLSSVKAALATHYLCMFGFPVYSSLGTDPDIPFPSPRDSLSGGHAVLAVGYDNERRCHNARPGALRIRNSWGEEWGDQGYGWLPYDYVRRGLATDFWTCFKLDWVDTGQFD